MKWDFYFEFFFLSIKSNVDKSMKETLSSRFRRISVYFGDFQEAIENASETDWKRVRFGWMVVGWGVGGSGG